MIEIDRSIPEMSPSSAVCPTTREVGATLHLAFLAPREEHSVLLRFHEVRDWHYGYPNDEGLDSHPLYGHGLEPYHFHVTPIAGHGERAWVATFHDGTLTVFAESVAVMEARYPGEPLEVLNSALGPGPNRELDHE